MDTLRRDFASWALEQVELVYVDKYGFDDSHSLKPRRLLPDRSSTFLFASTFPAASLTINSFPLIDSRSTPRPSFTCTFRLEYLFHPIMTFLTPPFGALHDSLSLSSSAVKGGCKWPSFPYARAGWPSAERRRQPISTRPIPFKPLPCPPTTLGPTSRQTFSRLPPLSTLPDSQPTDAPHPRPAPGIPAGHLTRSTPDVDLAQGRPPDARGRGQALGRDAADADRGGLPVQQGVSPSFVLLRRVDGELGRSERG